MRLPVRPIYRGRRSYGCGTTSRSQSPTESEMKAEFVVNFG
jgi:hypothetical protein